MVQSGEQGEQKQYFYKKLIFVKTADTHASASIIHMRWALGAYSTSVPQIYLLK